MANSVGEGIPPYGEETWTGNPSPETLDIILRLNEDFQGMLKEGGGREQAWVTNTL